MDTWCYVCLDECLLRVFLQNTTKVQHLNWHSVKYQYEQTNHYQGLPL